jgi:D-3-phosphoglycerate dehydrogenase / 2-oxoglutarate reductase
MSGKPLRVAYIDPPIYVSFAQVLEAAPEIELVRLTLDDPPETIAAALSTCDGYYVMASRDELPARFAVHDALLAQMPNLLVAASYGAGYDTIDVEACNRVGVGVVNQAGGNAEGVAEHTLAMMIALLKRIPETHAAMREGAIRQRDAFLGREIAGRTVGLVGLGKIGSRVAEMLAAFRCRILACDPYLDAATCAARGAHKVEMGALLADSDVVSIHCPLSGETRGMIGREAFAAMRPGAIFVNTARGGIHDEAALHDALKKGIVSGAGLDVWDQEPPPKEHPLLSHPCVLASPHMAGVTHESRDRVARMAAEAFLAVAAGKLPPRLVNGMVAERLMERIVARG